MTRANDTQVGGTHYKSKYQHWDLVIELQRNRYLEGQITRYVSRWRLKNGVQDLEKAAHYAKKLLEVVHVVIPTTPFPQEARRAVIRAYLDEYFSANKHLDSVDQEIIAGAVNWRCFSDVEKIQTLIAAQINAALASEPSKQYVDQG